LVEKIGLDCLSENNDFIL